MRPVHRDDNVARCHYSINQKSFISFQPELLYSGLLSKTRGWGDTSHSHPFLEILFIVDGTGSITVDGQEYWVKKGDIVIYNAGSTHFEHASTQNPMEAYFIAFAKIQLKDLPENCILPLESDCVFSAEAVSGQLSTLFHLINTEIVAKDEFYIEIAGKSAHTLLMYVFRVLNEKNIPFQTHKKDSILQNVLQYMDQHFTQEIGLEEISTKCFVNKYYLSHLFAEHLGVTVGQYIRDKRVEQAKKLLLNTTLCISDISAQCGFNDLNYFIRLFKKSIGLTPLQFRKKRAPTPLHNKNPTLKAG